VVDQVGRINDGFGLWLTMMMIMMDSVGEESNNETNNFLRVHADAKRSRQQMLLAVWGVLIMNGDSTPYKH
jgi:hypothetical protein